MYAREPLALLAEADEARAFLNALHYARQCAQGVRFRKALGQLQDDRYADRDREGRMAKEKMSDED